MYPGYRARAPPPGVARQPGATSSVTDAAHTTPPTATGTPRNAP